MTAFQEMEMMNPTTQTLEGVKALMAWMKRPADPLPAWVEIGGEVALVLNNKKDAYYTVTPMACSCPAFTYSGGRPCKHMRKHFPAAQESVKPVELDSWGNPRKQFQPFREDTIRGAV